MVECEERPADEHVLLQHTYVILDERHHCVTHLAALPLRIACVSCSFCVSSHASDFSNKAMHCRRV